ncbi:MAG: PDZ domain-containing protein [Bdellovibrionaceae bacterium]|nr:PDZ domain-containing protein [Pseudobdellovibrionaceae bacterium]
MFGIAITGQLQTADPHAFLQPSSDASENTEKSVVGLGVLVHYTDAGYDIREVIPGGAANEAGLQRRDQIVSINGEKIDFTYKTEDIVSRFLGQEGTTVDLTLKRNGKIFSLTLKRKTFTFKNITSQMINTNKKKIGLISLFTFNDTNACASVKEHAKVLIQKGVQALILDLRNNLGGLVSEGECVGSFFTGKEMRSDALPEALDIFSVKQENKEFELNIPLVLIVNEASASATEMLAGGLQDYKRAWILGENTFGKGSMQDVRVFDADSEGGTHIAMTTGLIYRPTGRPTQGQGVNPDIIVPVKKGLSAEERWAPREFDLFPNAIQVKQTPWQEQRPEEAKQLSVCAESANDNGDYQLSAALNVVDCL